MKPKHKLYYKIPDIFNCDIRDLEFLLSAWEQDHLKDNVFCSDVRCMGTYLMLRTAYDYRIKVQGLKKTFDIYNYARLDSFLNGDENHHIISGSSIRKFKRGDTVVLLEDIVDGDGLYIVKDVSWKKEGNINYFQAQMLFQRFENLVHNN